MRGGLRAQRRWAVRARGLGLDVVGDGVRAGQRHREPQTPTSRLLDGYRCWSAGREALTVREDGSGTSVAASEWETSDDQGVELAHRLADQLTRA